MQNAQINELLSDMGLSRALKFVPFSQSRNATEKHPSLNWKVTLQHKGRDILSTDYMQGCAHCRAYKQGDNTVRRDQMVRAECETGINAKTPDLRDIMYSLVMDSDVIDYPSFEEWASNFGYETDSRKAEAIYRACLDIALKLRAALGDDGLAKLREAFQDY